MNVSTQVPTESALVSTLPMHEASAGGQLQALRGTHRPAFSPAEPNRPDGAAPTDPARGIAAPLPMELMVVQIGAFAVCVPGASIREIVAVDGHGKGLSRLGQGLVLRLRDRLLGVVDGRALLGLPEGADAPSGRTLVIDAGGRNAGLLVDRILGTEVADVAPASPILRASACILGQAVLSGGRPALVIDPVACLCGAPRTDDDAKGSTAGRAAQQSERHLDYLVVRAGSGAPKAVAMAAVDRIERIRDGEIEVAAGSQVIQRAGRLLRLMPIAESRGGRLAVVVMAEAGPVGLLVDEVCDVTSVPASAFRDVGNGDLRRAAVIDGRAVDFLDVGGLLHADPVPAASAWRQ